MLYSILRSPLGYINLFYLELNFINFFFFPKKIGYFDIIPSGRLLNRLNKDQGDIDTNLPNNLLNSLVLIFSLVFMVNLIFFINFLL